MIFYMNNETFIIFEEEVIRSKSQGTGGVNQKEEVQALGKSRQVSIFWNTEELGV